MRTKILLTLRVLPLLLSFPGLAQLWPPIGASLPQATFASPPAFPALNQAFLFSDASATGVCTGGGTAYALCVWNGSGWAAAAGAGTGLGDPGSNSVPYRNTSGSTIPATATQMSGPNFCADAGSTDAYACNLSPVIASYVSGTLFWFKANTANSSGSSINFNGKGGLPLKKILGGITTDTVTGDISVGQWVACIPDGTNCQIASQLGTTVDTTSTQALTNKTVDGVSPTVFGFLDPTSSVQTQLNGKQASLGFTSENAANKDGASGYAGLDSGSKLKLAEMPSTIEQTGNKDTASGYAGLDSNGQLNPLDLAVNSNNCFPYIDNTGHWNKFCASSLTAGLFFGASGSPLQFSALAPSGAGGGGGGTNTYTTTTTASSSDDKKLVVMNGTNITYTLASTPPSTTWSATVFNQNSTPLMIARNGTTINTQNFNITLLQGQRAKIDTSGSNYYASVPDAVMNGLTLTPSLTGVTWQPDPAVVGTINGLLDGDAMIFRSTDLTSAYNAAPTGGCSSAPLKAGTVITLLTVTPSLTNASLTACTWGTISIKLADGVSDPGTSLPSNLPYRLFYDGTVYRYIETTGNATFGVPLNVFYVDSACKSLGNSQCYNTLALAMADANTRGGYVYDLQNGTQTISSTIPIGSNSAQTQVTLYVGGNVIFSCTMTNHTNCFQASDGSGMKGMVGYSLAAHGSVPQVAIGGSARVLNGFSCADQTGLQQSCFIDGFEFNGSSGGTVDQAMVHFRAAFSGTSAKNLTFANLYGTIGLLLDTNSGTTGASGTAIAMSSASGSGTTVTVTVPSTTDASPDGHRVTVGQGVNVAGCSGGTGTFTGTNLPVATILSNTSFTYTASGSVSGSPSSCTYTPVIAGGGNVTSVIELQNVVANGSGRTGARPIVFSARKLPGGIAGGLTNVKCIHCSAEGASAGGIGAELNGNGIVSALNGLHTIEFSEFHCEPLSTDPGSPIGMEIVDAHNVTVTTISGSGANSVTGGELVLIASTATNSTYNVRVAGLTKGNYFASLVDSSSPMATYSDAHYDIPLYITPGLDANGNPTAPIVFGPLGSTPVQTVSVSSANSDYICAHGGDTSFGFTCNNTLGNDAIFTGSNDIAFSTALQIPNGYMTGQVGTNKALELTLMFEAWAPATAPSLQTRLRWAGTNGGTNSGTTMFLSSQTGLSNSITQRGFSITCNIITLAAAGTSVNSMTECNGLAAGVTSSWNNNTAQPVAINTSTASNLYLNYSTAFSATGIASGTYTSGITATGTVGQTCTLSTFNNGNASGTATVALTGTNTIAGGTALVITNTGNASTSAATSATAGNGTATCSGTATVSTTLGGAQGAALRLIGYILKVLN